MAEQNIANEITNSNHIIWKHKKYMYKAVQIQFKT